MRLNFLKHRLSILIGFAAASLFVFSSCRPEIKTPEISIIPAPVSVEQREGTFRVRRNTPIAITQDTLGYLIPIAGSLWEPYLGFTPESTKADTIVENAINLHLIAEFDQVIGEEGYHLSIGENGVVIAANRPAGIFYGIQTIYQLLGTTRRGHLPLVEITDYPRFGWRGLHLDVSRHFKPIDFIFRYIDYMAKHKLNVFHWHLVDDQGWRLEIKKYPKLTEVGAWRVDKSHLHWDHRPLVNDPANATYGGFYTQEEVRAVVAYAAKRNITVLPEIGMPAHIMSALAAYPEFSCTGENLGVAPGGVWPITHIYCAGYDGTFTFLENIMLEVMDIFPSEFIHVGGDEATKTNWETCPRCQRRMRDEGLANVQELQSYFIARMERFLNAHGRRLIGWDEILYGGLAPNATVMSWRGEAGGIQAAQQGHNAVMTPGSHLYFDHYQGDPELEPLAIGGFSTLANVYSYEPIPAVLTPEQGKLILGAQANVWTEFMPNTEHVEYMVFPRLAALAEVVWSPVTHRNWGDFSRRMKAQYARYARLGINYSRSAFQVRAAAELLPENRSLRISLGTEVLEPEIRFTTDGTVPVANSPVYTEPLEITGTTTVKAAVFVNGESMEQLLNRTYVIHQAFAANVQLKYPNSPRWDAQGPLSLVNAIRGSRSHLDGNWQGFRGNDLVATVDLGQVTDINGMEISALHAYGTWIFVPQWVKFEVSTDGENFQLLEQITNEHDIYSMERSVVIYRTDKPFENVRFVRVTARNQGVCPPGHSGEGLPAWLFVDEIVVY